MGKQRPRVQTTPSTVDWARAVTRAWRTLLPATEPTMRSLAVLWAQFALETGRGKYCYCHNLGNIKHVDGDAYDWCVLNTFEYFNGNRVDMPDTFRAYDSLDDGALDYLRFLCRQAYAEPWAQVVAGSPEGFARALKRKGYYTAPVEEYVSGLRSLAGEFTRHVAGVPDVDAQPLPLPAEASPTRRDTPAAIAAVREPIADYSLTSPATVLRAGEGEHTLLAGDQGATDPTITPLPADLMRPKS